MDKKPLIVVSIMAVVLLVLGSLSNVVGYQTQYIKKPRFLSLTETRSSAFDSINNETELKYYQEDSLDLLVGLQGPGIWKSAIRLTQMEMASYKDWALTKINVAFSADNGCPWIDIRLYIYDKGDAMHPGPIIANDTTRRLDASGIITIPLVSAVNLSNHEELWIAVEWDQTVVHEPGEFYAWMATITSPAVDGKGDWANLNNYWEEAQYWGGGEYDGNWGIGAIIQGPGSTELSIRDIEGPVGLSANVSNIGFRDAVSVTWSIAVNGGLLNKVAVLETKSLSSLVAGSSVVVTVSTFFGLGKIHIIVSARADNAPEISVAKTAFLFGPFVVKIR